MLTSETYASTVDALTHAVHTELKRQNSLGVFTQAPLVKEVYDLELGNYRFKWCIELLQKQLIRCI